MFYDIGRLTLIQVIPFLAKKEPFFLPLLARGLSDLSALRFNAVGIEAQVNTNLEIKEWEQINHQIINPHAWTGQDLWFSAEVNNTVELSMRFLLYDPAADVLIYQDHFQVPENQFLVAWEQHLLSLIGFLNKDIDLNTVNSDNLRMYTQSLEAFLAFRKGLETLSQARNDRLKEEGLENLLEAVAYDPDFTEAVDILLLFIMQNDFSRNIERIDHCINILERLRNIAIHHPRVPLVLTECYFRWGNKEKAEQTLKEMIEAFPEFIEGRLRLALFYHTVNRLPEAIRVLEGILEFEPSEPTALDLMGAIYAGEGESNKAEAVWLKAIEADPTRVNVLNNLAILAEENNDLDNAEAYYRKALKLSDDWWGTYYHYGTFCWHQERYEEAVIWLERACQSNPAYFQIFQNLGLVLIEIGKYTEAQDTLMKVLQLAPDNTVRRQTLQLMEQFNKPTIQLEIQIRQLEKIWDAGNHLSVIKTLFFKYPKAKKYWFYWYLLGNIMYQSGRKTLAAFLWQMGLRYNPGYPLIKQVGLYYWNKGNYRKALPILRKAYQLHQSDDDTAKAYFQTLVNLGEVEELRNNIHKLSQIIPVDIS
jgi:tetratricopeptide (TPR) repeat protein